MKLVSFDIFDTVLIRKCGKPENVYLLIAKALYPNDLARQDEFIKWRILRNSGVLEKNYNISDVYATSDIESFSEFSYEQLIATELKIEEEQLTHNCCAMSILGNYRKQGYEIAFISDMYLSENFIQGILVREEISKKGDYVYVSNEVKCRKDDGSLFDYVRVKLHPDEWIHFGDNLMSDYKIPKSKGIKVHRIVLPYTDIEKCIDGLSPMLQSSYELSLLAGLERAVRSEFLNTPESRIVVDFQSAAYIPYVRYLLEDSRKRGIKRLYFLSRDSYILEKIAKQIPHSGIELKYLFVSRESLVLPYLYKASKEQFSLIFVNEWLNIDKLLSRLRLSRKQLKEFGITFDFVEVDTEKQRREFLNAMFRPDIYVIWQKEAQVQHNLCIGYFEQEGLFEDCRCALVDVGWLGTTRLMINAIREAAKPDIEQCYSYYWSIRFDVISGKYGNYNTFIHDIKITSTLTFILEDYFSLCPYPTTKSYKRVGSHFEPILKNIDTTFITEKASYNEKILKTFISLIENYHISNSVLYTWAVFSMKCLQEFKFKGIDYSPFENICSNNIPLVKRLSISDMLKIIWGLRVSRLDQASLYLSYGYYKGKILWNVQRLICKIKVVFKTFLRRLIQFSCFEKLK